MTRILVIEPEVRVRVALRCMLEVAGFDVDVAADSADGVARLKARPADLVIADLDEVAVHSQDYSGVPFIAVPGNGRRCPKTAEAARRLGAQAFLPKPFARSELLATVHASLGAVSPVAAHA